MLKLQGFKKKLKVQFMSAQIDTILRKLSENSIILYDITLCDELTAEVWINECDLGCLESVMHRSATQYNIVGRRGILWYTNVLIKRPIFTVGLILFLIATLWIPGRILFVQVEGNTQIPERYILECANDCGIHIGADRKTVRSEKTKNELLSKIPQLQWVGVNTNGCIAEISVQEGIVQPKENKKTHTVSAIVAANDGVIESISVLKGTGMCTVGQTVKKGDVLISGYTDCGLKVLAETAQGEVFAYTNHSLHALALKPTVYKGHVVNKQVSIRLRIGKKLIKLWNDSGISGTTCDKMYVEEYWTLPGGFRLPIVIIKDITIYYSEDNPAELEQPTWIAEFVEGYLRKQMIAGKILTQDISCWDEAQCWVFSGAYACHEMIGKVKYEEALLKNAKDN